MPSIRLGRFINAEQKPQEYFLLAKEQISISGSVINEWSATQLLPDRQTILALTNKVMGTRFDMVRSWIEKEDLLGWIEPASGVVCFPRMMKEPAGGTAPFYERLLKYQTYVGLGHWFEMPDTFFALGFGWPTREEILGDMETFSKALRDSD
jgi:DNA-binding transcriptional MocR family regulator